MAEMMTVSHKGQITIPVEIREKYGIKGGDRVFGEEIEEGFIIRKPKKNLLDYKGFIKAKPGSQTEGEAARQGLSAHVMGEEEC